MQTAANGTNASGMRRFNERLILSAVRRLGGASKAELSRVTALSAQAVVRIVDELEAEGMLVQAGKRKGGMGQPATIFQINGKRGHTLGIEVGRNALTMVLLDFDGGCKALDRVPISFPSVRFVLNQIERFSQAQALGSTNFMGVGIAMPWFLGEWRDEMGISDAQASEWHDPAVETRLRDGIAWPVHFENDGNAATLAQSLCGAARDIDDFLSVHLGTFVGGGVVIGGRVVQGRHGNAGALASMPVCVDGERDYLIHHASLYTLPGDADVAARAKWVERCADALGFAVISASSLLDFGTVVLDGAISAELLGEVAVALERRLSGDTPKDFFAPMVRRGSLGDSAPAIGAGLLPLHASYTPDIAALTKPPAAQNG